MTLDRRIDPAPVAATILAFFVALAVIHWLLTRAITDAVAVAADGLGLTPALWVRDAPGVTAPLLGARTPEQLQPYLDAEDESLPDQIVSALDDVSGGPNQLRAGA